MLGPFLPLNCLKHCAFPSFPQPCPREKIIATTVESSYHQALYMHLSFHFLNNPLWLALLSSPFCRKSNRGQEK